MFMNKREKSKLRKEYKSYLEKSGVYNPVHDKLIEQLVDWIDIDEFTKTELMNDPTSWTLISTISVASKNIQSLMTKLSLTPQAIQSQTKKLILENSPIGKKQSFRDKVKDIIDSDEE